MSRAKGLQAESEACAYLEGLGFEIIERNFFARYGEIDIIAKRANLLHFIEVKSGIGFEPVFNITPAKIAKVQKLKLFHKIGRIFTPFYIKWCVKAGDICR